jgi:shikimate kinase
VLIGLSGAGKSSVAPHVARLLDTTSCDLDERVVAAEGRSIAAIFATDGEARFRTMEHAALLAALDETPQVIAAGGGWAAQPGNLAAVAGRALVLYLSVTPAEAARRLAGATDRPMLTGAPAEARLAELLAARERWYRLADLEIATGSASPEVVAAGVVTAARQYGGW